MRVEGATHTIFEGPVITDVHQVKTPSDIQPRTCDGSSVGNPSAPTAIGALDDAARGGSGFSWDALWDASFNDYYPFLRIGPDAIDSNTHYLAFYLNWAFADTGGCGQHVKQGDDVVFAYEDFEASPLLRLTGPGTATTGENVSFKVVDGLTSAPQAAVSVGGATTGADGTATLSFAQRGIYRLKADKPGAIRSNTVVLCVDPGGRGPVQLGDTSGPDAPGRDSRRARWLAREHPRPLAHDADHLGRGRPDRQRHLALQGRGEQAGATGPARARASGARSSTGRP